MKITLLISMLLFNAFCMGQHADIDNRFYKLGYVKALDSVKINFGVSEIENAEAIKAKDNYEWADSVWINQDTTHIVFRYFKKDEIDSITVDCDTSHLFQHHKSGKVDTFELEKAKIETDSFHVSINEGDNNQIIKSDPMINNGVLGRSVMVTENGKFIYGGFEKVNSCRDFIEFKKEFPEFIIPQYIKNKFRCKTINKTKKINIT